MIDIKALYALLLNEANTESLQAIDKSVYKEIADALASMKGQGYEGLEAKVRDALVDMISMLADALLSIRIAKHHTNPSNLTYEERYIINSLDDYRVRYDYVKQSILEGRAKVLEGIVEGLKAKRIMVRFLQDVEQFVAVDDNRYGPYRREDIAMLPLEDAKRLINDGYAVELSIVE